MVKFYEGLGEELSLYVRYMAWLHTAPISTEKRSLDSAEPISRLAKMEKDGIIPMFPPNSAPHLVNYLMEIGPVEAAGMDGAPIGWATMRHWQHQMAIELQPWEARLIRRLSAEYLTQSIKARKPDCPAPWGQMTDDDRDAISAKIRSVFGGLAKNKIAA